MADESVLGIIINAQNNAGKVLQELNGQMDNVKSKVSSLQPAFKTMAIAGTAAFTAVSGVIITSIMAYSQAEKQIAKVDATLKAMEGTTMEVAGATEEMVTGFKLTGVAAEAVSNKIKAETTSIKEDTLAMGKLNDKLKEGKITQEDYDIGVEKLQNSINESNTNIKSYNEQLEETITTQVKTTKSVQLMTEGFEKVRARIMEASKATIQLGFDDEDAAVSITKFFQRTGDLSEAIKSNNLTMDLARAKSIDLASATQLVNLALSGSGRALLQYGIVIKDSASPLEALTILQKAVAGQAVAYTKTFSGQSEILQMQIKNLREAIGRPFAEALTNLLTKIQPVIDGVVRWAEENPKLIEKILLTTAAVAGLVAILGTLGLLLPQIINGFKIALGPVGWVMFAIGLLTTYLITHKEAWNKIVDIFNQYVMPAFNKVKDFVIDNFVPALQALWAGIQDVANAVVQYLIPPLTKLYNFLEDSVIPTVKILWATMINFVTPAFELLWNVLSNQLFPALSNMWSVVKEKLFPALMELWNVVLEPLAKLLGGALYVALLVVIDALALILSLVAKILTWLTQLITFLVEKASGSIQRFVDDLNKIVNAFKQVWEWGQKAAKYIGGAIGNAISGSGGNETTYSGIPNYNPNQAFLPQFAEGGIVPGNLGQPVPILAHAGETVIPKGKSFGDINITITGNTFMSDDDAAEKIGDRIIKILTQQNRFAY